MPPDLVPRPPDFRRRPRIPLPGLRPLPPDPQQLVPSTTTPNVLEGLEARVKDPLFFLARQLQTGEFEAENGGSLAQLEVAWRSAELRELICGASRTATPLAAGAPLEAQMEAEAPDGAAPAWVPNRLEYAFRLRAGNFELAASEYDGVDLEWYHFDVASAPPPSMRGPEQQLRVLPRSLRLAATPDPRWWRFEDADLDVTQLASARPTVLQGILAEFALIDAADWWVFPLELEAGRIRKIERLTAVDAFGVRSEIPPAIARWDDGGWQAFTLSSRVPGANLDGSFFYLPNVAAAVTDGEPAEELELARDEASNVVWAIERYYTETSSGRRVNRGDVEAAADRPVALRPPVSGQEDLPVFRLKTPLGRHWIPYVPRRAPPVAGAASPEIYLRRARSDETASASAPQYRTRIVRESWRIEEEEIPRTGLRVRRLPRFARGTDGEPHVWMGRRKEVLATERSASLDFDLVIDRRRPTAQVSEPRP